MCIESVCVLNCTGIDSPCVYRVCNDSECVYRVCNDSPCVYRVCNDSPCVYRVYVLRARMCVSGMCIESIYGPGRRHRPHSTWSPTAHT